MRLNHGQQRWHHTMSNIRWTLTLGRYLKPPRWEKYTLTNSFSEAKSPSKLPSKITERKHYLHLSTQVRLHSDHYSHSVRRAPGSEDTPSSLLTCAFSPTRGKVTDEEEDKPRVQRPVPGGASSTRGKSCSLSLLLF